MESFFAVITSLSNIIGVPASIGLAWAAFIIRDHGKRITALEDEVKYIQNKFSNALKELDTRYAQTLKEMDIRRMDELNKIYDRLNKMSDDVSYIRGRFDKEAEK